METKVYKIEDAWGMASEILASDTDKKLICRTHFDGNGNSKVRFVIINGNYTKQTEYEKFDAAATAYNLLP